ncbi:hypothetical protein MYCTH_2302093, partial [Thermothelomyces thermophilus ATCC 42464]
MKRMKHMKTEHWHHTARGMRLQLPYHIVTGMKSEMHEVCTALLPYRLRPKTATSPSLAVYLPPRICRARLFSHNTLWQSTRLLAPPNGATSTRDSLLCDGNLFTDIEQLKGEREIRPKSCCSNFHSPRSAAAGAHGALPDDQQSYIHGFLRL